MQHTKIRTLDHCYSPFGEVYKALPQPLFGKSDHISISQLPTIRKVHRWSDQSDSVLQDCFDDADWEMLHEVSNNNIDEYTDSVTGFIRKCIEDVVRTRTVRVYPKQKPWLNCEVHAALDARTAAFKSGNMDEYKKPAMLSIRPSKQL
ncbi:hypothetical protein MHYP_G00109790 [Metynnis hypsauchen]